MGFKKIIIGLCFIFSLEALAKSFYDVRSVSSSPFLFNMIDAEKKDHQLFLSYVVGRSFYSEKIARSLTMNKKSYFILNEQGLTTTSSVVEGDVNPVLIGLTDDSAGHGHAGSYHSTVQLKPKIVMHSFLFHYHRTMQNFFVDIKSALGLCMTQIAIFENGGKGGSHDGIEDFADAMSNKKWKYGKMGSLQKKCGVDHIQIKGGKQVEWNQSSENIYFAAPYFVVELPTGPGSKSEWALEPRVGKNHVALGLGVGLFQIKEGLFCEFDVNWRYFLGARETRSFDTFKNGEWSRYLPVVSIPAPTSIHKSISGINFFTREATIIPGSQIIGSARCSKQWKDLNFECGTSFLFKQKELVSQISQYNGAYGIYDNYSLNGNTASYATIQSFKPETEVIQQSVEVQDLNPDSAASGSQFVPSVFFKIESVKNVLKYGLGGSVEAGFTENSYYSWSLWINAGASF